MIPKVYAYLLLAGLLLAGIGGLYWKGRIDQRHASEVTSLKADLQAERDAANAERNARLQDSILATENAKREAALRTKVTELNDYVDGLEDRDRECLSGADVDRLRHLWDQ